MMKIEHFGREQIRILAVDDNPVALLLLEKLLGRHDGYVVRTAIDGSEALQHLRSRPDATDIVLLDRMMPGIDGLAVCAAMKADERLRYIPVIMQTAADRPEEIVEGIRAGVFYYLTKPLDKDTLLSVVGAAAKQVKLFRQLRGEMHQWKIGFGLVQALSCTFRTIAEGESLATMLANFFPVPERALTGISELLVNAVEHGNLAIDYEAKGRLIRDNSWDDEIARRLADPRYSVRKVEVLFERREDACSIRITDDGDGFEWRRYLEFDPARATDNHGRGIAMANMLCFDTLVFNERGNQVTGIVAR
ncbi:MAG TPA: response regulator [Desulfoprunum sp.]|nr:response regulator [Desulfoprunum sp.]